MSNDALIMDQIILIRMDHHLFVRKRKALFYRQLLLSLALVTCRIITLEQILLLNNLTINQENIIRKDLSTYCKQGYLIRESFMYCDRFATYSLTKKGLGWLEDNFPLSIASNGAFNFNRDSLKGVYRERRKDKPSNHLVCINQVRLGIICCAKTPLHIQISQEQPCSVAGYKLHTYKKDEGLIVPDLMVGYNDIPIYFEADTTTVAINSRKGNAEKLSKYAMMSSPLEKKFECKQTHVVFSIQKNIDLQPQISLLSPEAARIFDNPEFINQSVTIIRLIAALNDSDTVLNTIEDIMEYMHKHTPFLEESLQKSPLILHASTLLSGLIQLGFSNEPLSNLRKVISSIYSTVKENHYSMKHELGLSIAEKRKSEIYMAIINSKHILWNCQHGLSVSCLYGPLLSHGLSFVLPVMFYSPEDITNRLRNCGIITKADVLKSTSPSLPCRMIHKGGRNVIHYTGNYDVVMNNAYHYTLMDGHDLTVFIENISDDIGGYLRAQKYIQLPPGFRNDTFLLMLIRDDLITADGKSVYDGGIYYDAASGSVPLFINPDTGLADKSGLHVLNHFINQRSDYALPFLYGITQDYAYLTYSEFSDSTECLVESKLYLPVTNDIIVRHRGNNTFFSPCKYKSAEDIEQYSTFFPLS